CFTNSEKIISNTWKVVKIKKLHRDPRRSARLTKILGHKIFHKHKINIWIDGSFLIKGSINKFCKKFYNNSLSYFEHPKRNCAYEEIEATIFKDDSNLLRIQSQDYKKKGLPRNFGLISSGILLRNNLNQKVKILMDCWVNQVEKYSSRDQVSFSFCIWNLNQKYDPIPLYIYENEYFQIDTHSKFLFFNNKGKIIFNSKFLYNWLKFSYNFIKFKLLKLVKTVLN
ncbi:DUF616 domain-containing protein, partial [Candidatus Pelagibacter sp.]|nr:DUF616 domain-containing protein [Candidatus Pelagibacter sp.]